MVLALLLSLISVTGALIPALFNIWNYRSKCYIRIVGPAILHKTDEDLPVLLVLAANEGGRPAFIRSASMTFKGIPLKPVSMEIANSDQKLLMPGKNVQLQLSALHMETTGASRDDVLKALAAGSIIVAVVIEETSRFGDHDEHADKSPTLDEGPAKYVKGMVLKRVQ